MDVFAFMSQSALRRAEEKGGCVGNIPRSRKRFSDEAGGSDMRTGRAIVLAFEKLAPDTARCLCALWNIHGVEIRRGLAEVMDVPIRTVMSRIQRAPARRLLRNTSMGPSRQSEKVRAKTMSET